MEIQNIPEIFLTKADSLPDLFVYDYRMNADVVKNKVDLGLNMFSFLQIGQKKVHFANAVVAVNEDQSLLIESGNCLFTELLNNENTYFCKLFFFSQAKVNDFLEKHAVNVTIKKNNSPKETPYFIIENDAYIRLFVTSLASITVVKKENIQSFLALKFEEIMLYLMNKYGMVFTQYAYSLIKTDNQSSFKKIIEANVYSNLKLEELAFLCNSSLSTFKRNFVRIYATSPGKWLQQKRLQKAKELLQDGKFKASDIYLDFGYDNLSNFSIAFKNEFGFSPKKTI